MNKENFDKAKKNWDSYKETSIIPTNDQLIEMMQNLVDCMHLLDAVYGTNADLIRSGIISDYFSLRGMATARNMDKYPSLIENK